jgi:hypothetical protein
VYALGIVAIWLAPAVPPATATATMSDDAATPRSRDRP